MRAHPIPDFSTYDGGDAFYFQNKLFVKQKRVGNGSYGEVCCFESEDHTKLAVKSELPSNEHYEFAHYFYQEAEWYQKIYGLGVFSGNLEKHSPTPRYILVPYFEGETLYRHSYPSIKYMVYCWIKTAEATHYLHTRHGGVHGDLKSDNVVLGKRGDHPLCPQQKEQVFLIDFGLLTKSYFTRDFHLQDTPENRRDCRHYPPEVFTTNKIVALPMQDYYGLGVLLQDLYGLFLKQHQPIFIDTNTTDTLMEIIQCLTQKDAWSRRSIPESIYMLTVFFFSPIPRMYWSAALDKKTLLQSNQFLMQNILRVAACSAIQLRQKELYQEQEMLEKSNKKSRRKKEKILGLQFLKSEIMKNDPAFIDSAVAEAKKNFPELMAGFFSNRTKSLLNKISEATLLLN